MKGNELKRLLKTVQFKTEKTIDEIAAEIGYSRPYLTNQVNIGVNETIRKVLNEKYGEVLKQDVRYSQDAPSDSLAAQIYPISQNTHKDKQKDKLTTTTAKLDYGVRPTNGNQTDKDATIKAQADAANKIADTVKSQQDLIADLARNVMQLTGKLIDKK